MVSNKTVTVISFLLTTMIVNEACNYMIPFFGGRAPLMTELVLRVLLYRKHAKIIYNLHSSTALVMRLTSIPETK